ncbi:MAG: hypothetical protein JWO19_3776 [Bryobacterales bacterium]|nr:hypothetical protein [Bryobacterales bacterium]
MVERENDRSLVLVKIGFPLKRPERTLPTRAFFEVR